MSEHSEHDIPLLIGSGFYDAFLATDQKLMESGEWDSENPNLDLNRQKLALESIDDSTLSKEQLLQKKNALWLWYHHAAQDAYFRHRNRDAASTLIDKALMYRDSVGLNNQITPLLKLLFSNRIDEARTFADSLPDMRSEKDAGGTMKEIENYEKKTALQLVSRFESEAEE